MTTDINELLARLNARLADLGDIRNWRTDNERIAHQTTSQAIARIMTGVRNVPHDLARADERLAVFESQRQQWLAKEAEILQAISDAPDPATFDDARERDAAYEERRHLQRQL
jgi:hypothetical protein